MSVINKFFIILTAICLTLLAVNMSFINLASTSDGLNDALRRGGVYGSIAPAVSDVFISGIKSSRVSNEQLIGAIRQAITPSVIEASFRPAVVSLTSWLKDGGTADVPSLNIDMKPIKSVLNEQIVKALPGEQIDAVQFEITKSVPDNLSLENMSSPNNSTETKIDHANTALIEFARFYQFSNSLMMSLLAGSAFGSVVIFMVNLRHTRKKLRDPAWPFLLASIFLIILIFAIPIAVSLILPSDIERSTNNILGQVMANFVIGAVSSFWLYVVVYGGIAITGLIASFMLIHPNKDR